MKKVLVLIAVFFFVNIPAKAATLTFEDVAPKTKLIDYAGFSWLNTAIAQNLGNNFAYNINHLNIDAKLIIPNTHINLESMEFLSRNWLNSVRQSISVTLEGYLRNTLTYSLVINIPDSDSFTLFNIGFKEIDEFRIVDADHENTNYHNNYSIDEIICTPAPEPSSMVLGIIGLGSLFGVKRRKLA